MQIRHVTRAVVLLVARMRKMTEPKRVNGNAHVAAIIMTARCSRMRIIQNQLYFRTLLPLALQVSIVEMTHAIDNPQAAWYDQAVVQLP